MSQELIQEMDECIKMADDGHIVKATHRLLSCLDRHGHLRQARLLPDEVAVHVLNRDGFGVSATDCHQLISKIGEVGWSDRETNPICAELSPDDWDKHKKFNMKLSQASNGMLPVLPDRFRYASLAGSHTNAALRCLIHEVEVHHELDTGLSMDGCFSMARVQSVDTGMHLACTQGMMWKIISKEAAMVPGVAELVQQAANASGQLASGEGEFQILKRMHGMMANCAGNVMPEWGMVRTRISRSKPACFEAMPRMYQFLIKYLDEDKFAELDSRIKRSSSLTKSLGSDFWEAMQADGKDWQQPCRSFRWAMLSSAYNAAGKQFSPSDIKRMLSKDFSPKVSQAEDLMAEVRNAVGTHRDQVQDLLDSCMDHIVMVALDKARGLSIEQVALHFVEDVEKRIKVRISTQWDNHKAEHLQDPGATEEPSSSATPKGIQ
eukprot:Skav222050  [mRNA]  locus=scaffold1020:505380:506684:+ [translate_table: standard]